MKAKYKKSIILASSALSLMIGAAIVLSSNENLFSIMMRAANQSVTNGTITFSGTPGTSATRNTTSRTVQGAPIVCHSVYNDTQGANCLASLKGSTSKIYFWDTSNNDFVFQDLTKISLTRTTSFSYLSINVSYELVNGTTGKTSNVTFYSGNKDITLTGLGAKVAKATINCVSTDSTVDISNIVLTYNCTPVVVVDLESISVTTAPTKTTYYVGETFDPTGMVVTATYSDGSTDDVVGYTYSTSPLALEDKEIQISYTERGITKTTTQAISVEAAPVLQSIAVTTAPTKTTYTEGECFDPTGMVVTATYDKGPTRDVTDECTFSPDEETSLTTSDTSITISYGGQTTTQVITVEASAVDYRGTYTNGTITMVLSGGGTIGTLTYTYIETQNISWSVTGTTITLTYVSGAKESDMGNYSLFKNSTTVTGTISDTKITVTTYGPFGSSTKNLIKQ